MTPILQITRRFGALSALAASVRHPRGHPGPHLGQCQLGSVHRRVPEGVDHLLQPLRPAVTSGSLLSIPFVWKAVSSAPAPTGYSRPSSPSTNPSSTRTRQLEWLPAHAGGHIQQPIQPGSPGDRQGSCATLAVQQYPPFWGRTVPSTHALRTAGPTSFTPPTRSR